MTDLRKAARSLATTSAGKPNYCTPQVTPQVTPEFKWVGLTDADKQEAFDETQEASGGFWEFADYLEAKLKEKNT